MITIDGRQVPLRGEATVLEVARREGIWIPTLCHHPGLAPYGACRLCLVEVKDGGKPGLAASCVLPATCGLVVETASPRVNQTRRILIQLLLAVVPDAPAIRELALQLGVSDSIFKAGSKTKSRCVLCGLCVRVCGEVGANAIGFAFRGPRRKVTPPFEKDAEKCLGCQACANICPTGEVKFTEQAGQIAGEPWQSRVDYAQCASCGAPFAPAPFLAKLRERVGLEETGDLCPACRRRKLFEIVGA